MKSIFDFILVHWDSITSIILMIASVISTIVVAVKNKNWNKLCKMAKECMTEVENFGHYTPEEKKAYVITKTNQYALSKKIKFNTEKVSAFVEELITLSKEINAREKDKNSTK